MKSADLKVYAKQSNAFGYMGHRVEVVSVGSVDSKITARIGGAVKEAVVPNTQLRWLGR